MPHHSHRDLRGGGARAAVFGVSDGLVTNVSLVLGMAGANPGASIVRLAGVAGLIAGSFSMAAGEYLSMTAQRELMERELEVERRSLSHSPEGEAAELRGMYVQRGIDPAVATDMVNEVMQDPELALETHAREELGITPAESRLALAGRRRLLRHLRHRRLRPAGAVAVHLGDGRPSCCPSCWVRWRCSWSWASCWPASPSGPARRLRPAPARP